MDIYSQKSAQDDLDAFKEFAESTFQSSLAFAHRVRMRKAAAVHQGQTQTANANREGIVAESA